MLSSSFFSDQTTIGVLSFGLFMYLLGVPLALVCVHVACAAAAAAAAFVVDLLLLHDWFTLISFSFLCWKKCRRS